MQYDPREFKKKKKKKIGMALRNRMQILHWEKLSLPPEARGEV